MWVKMFGFFCLVFLIGLCLGLAIPSSCNEEVGNPAPNDQRSNLDRRGNLIHRATTGQSAKTELCRRCGQDIPRQGAVQSNHLIGCPRAPCHWLSSDDAPTTQPDEPGIVTEPSFRFEGSDIELMDADTASRSSGSANGVLFFPEDTSCIMTINNPNNPVECRFKGRTRYVYLVQGADLELCPLGDGLYAVFCGKRQSQAGTLPANRVEGAR